MIPTLIIAMSLTAPNNNLRQRVRSLEESRAANDKVNEQILDQLRQMNIQLKQIGNVDMVRTDIGKLKKDVEELREWKAEAVGALAILVFLIEWVKRRASSQTSVSLFNRRSSRRREGNEDA